MNLIYEYLWPTMLSIEHLQYLEYIFFQNKIGFVKKFISLGLWIAKNNIQVQWHRLSR